MLVHEKYENLKALHQAAVGTSEVPIQDFENAIAALEKQQEPINQITVLDQLEYDAKLSPKRRIRIEARLENIDAGGMRRLGRYRMLSKLGQGKMGAVYEAEDTETGKKFAVKVLAKELRKNRTYNQRFKREIQISMALNHPSIIRCFDYGELDGFLYYSMEVLKGRTLRAVLKTGPLKPTVAARFIMDIADGLAHAHAAGIIHRDIKPENLFLTEDGTAKILDLGLSKNIEKEEVLSLTMEGVALGTPYYMSPEQTRGEKAIDGRTDIYALGGTFFTLLTGEVPFTGNSMTEVMLKHNTQKVRDPRSIVPDIPEVIVQVLFRMMEKDPLARYQDCNALNVALEKALKPPKAATAGGASGSGAGATAVGAALKASDLTPRPKLSDTAKKGTATIKKKKAGKSTEKLRPSERIEAQPKGGLLGWVVLLLMVLALGGVLVAHYSGLIHIGFLP
ncbi:MAG: serine/threonine protein kinase [Planctomycetota bacterium]